ncbi:MAG: GDP-mannose 4,6-dehydratase [Phycisphaeraceae bacterium]|nr:GDP-mannose 4,6-dehydratase [Phycisphaeraceae bacterium]
MDAASSSSGPPARHALVTGGAGFIGSHLVDRLLAEGSRVTVVDDLSTGRRTNVPEGHERLRFIQSDLTVAIESMGADERFDEIYHLAAAVGVQLVVREPIRCIETNVLQTGALLRFAADHGRNENGCPTLIASSSEVYGKGSKTPFHEEDDVVYGPTTVSRWSYACSKAIDEYLALAYHAAGRTPCVIARFFNTIGPRQVGDYGMVVPRFVGAALAGGPIEVHGDGTQSRCFADVRDVSTILPRLLRSGPCLGRVFNVGADDPISIGDLALRVRAVVGSESEIRLVPYDQAYSVGFEDLRQRRPDLTRIREAVGYRPILTLEESIRDIASWMRSEERAWPSC